MKPLYWVTGLGLTLLSSVFGYYVGKHSLSVHADRAIDTHASKDTKTSESNKKNHILYYRNPMGLSDTSPTPKQDSMGMDYIPVYGNEISSDDLVWIDSRKTQILGVQTQAAKRQLIGREMRALGNIQIDESRLVNISPRFNGWVTNLVANTSGKYINKGEILFDAIIPNLFYAELAYRQAVTKTIETAMASPEVRLQAGLQLNRAMERLEEMGVLNEEMERLQRGGEPFFQIPYRSPSNGIILEKDIIQGSRFSAGDRLYQLADLSKLWLIVQLPEQQLNQLKVGDSLRTELIAEPGKFRKTKIDFIYPSLDPVNRSIKVRATLDNTDYTLKPGQSAEVWLETQAHKALVIPANALLDSGLQQWVLVSFSKGLYQPRKVKAGERNLNWIEITEGLSEGEEVVINATFLIDSESRLQSALTNFGQVRSEDFTRKNDVDNDTAKQSETNANQSNSSQKSIVPKTKHEHSSTMNSHMEH